MNVLELLPLGALVLAAGAAIASALTLRNPADARLPRLAALLSGLSAAAAALAFAILLSLFVRGDVSVEYVFLYTKTTLALPWRIAGTWAGREGSLLLWSALLAVVAAAVARSHLRRPTTDPAEEKGRAWTRLFLALFATAFLAAVVAQKTFAPTPEFYLQGRPQGNGLNPTLKSAFILIHPPLMFVAYALSTVPAAAVLGHLASGTDRWGKIGLFWSRLDWAIYTFAMGLGGIWAYYTLGFGGYWAWDPVEVANLLPWLALTVYAHAQLHHARHGSYKVIGPLLGLLPFLLTLFSTLSTRSGLWVSVHAFTDPTNTFDPDAPARFLAILAVEPSLIVYVRLFLGTFALGLALWALRLAQEQASLRRAAPVIAGVLATFAAYAALAPRAALSLLFELSSRVSGGRPGYGLLAVSFAAVVAAASPALFARHEPAKEGSGPRLNLRSLAAYAVATLGLGLLVLFLFHMAAVNGWDTKFYEARLPLLAAPAALGLLVLQAHSLHGRKRSLQLAGALAALAVIAYAVAPSHREGWTMLVLCVPLLLVSLDKVRRAALPPGVGKRQRLAPTLLWLGALLDLLFWLNPPSRVGLGPLSWHPVWPTQAILGAVALYALWASHRVLAGAAPRAPWHVPLLVALLGGFWVAPLLALAAVLLARRQALPPAPLDAKAKARLRQAALYGLHLAVAVALLGYTVSTYWKETTQADVDVGGSLTVAGATLTLDDVATAGAPFAEQIRPTFHVERRGADGDLRGLLHFEEDVGAYFPLPATLRGWDGDLYLTIHAVRVAESACSAPRTIEAYQAAQPPQACSGDTFAGAAVEVAWLPGLGLVWLALALFVANMAMLLAMEPASRVATLQEAAA